ncbi:hypothetical protein [Myxococcus fulvus]|uniref:hypothetical protein n=1 Tax=Myxococcus fulvus TaxID=33 RepID=UPI0020BF502C|nr:hypothetical protein [Myxococcus fulvus]MCK8504208.1 hypothetical protein [Myxococcus fulvus]
MPVRVCHIVIIREGKAELFRYGHDGKQALSLIIGGPEYVNAPRILSTLGWRRVEVLEDARSTACVDFDRKLLLLGGDFGVVRREGKDLIYEMDLETAFAPCWPGWRYEFRLGFAVDYLLAHARSHGLVLPANRSPEAELRFARSVEADDPLEHLLWERDWRACAAGSPPPVRLSDQHRGALLTRLESLDASLAALRDHYIFVGDVVAATARELELLGVDLERRLSLLRRFEDELGLDLSGTMPAFLMRGLVEARGWTLPVALPGEWPEWRRQALG